MGAQKVTIVAALICAVFALGITACGGTDQVANPSITSTRTADLSPTPTSALILPIAGPAEEGAIQVDVGTAAAMADVVGPTAQADTPPATAAIDRSAFVVPAADAAAPASSTEPLPAEQPPADFVPSQPSTLPLAEGCLGTEPVADVTIPDGTPINAGETYTKIWRMRNSGACAWNDALGTLNWAFVGGERMNGPDQVPIVGPVPAGGETDVQVELTAPTAPGLYEGRWQLHGPDGVPVGVVFWVLIEVPGDGAPTSEAEADSPLGAGGAGDAQPAEGVDLGQEIWQLINGERDRQSLYQLAYNPKLTAAAQKHAEDCSQRGECSHTGSDGSDEAVRVLREGYEGSADESWAWSASPSDAVNWWLDEVPPNDWHRRMLLSDYLREVGVGVAPAPSGGHFFVAVFGIPGH